MGNKEIYLAIGVILLWVFTKMHSKKVTARKVQFLQFKDLSQKIVDQPLKLVRCTETEDLIPEYHFTNEDVSIKYFRSINNKKIIETFDILPIGKLDDFTGFTATTKDKIIVEFSFPESRTRVELAPGKVADFKAFVEVFRENVKEFLDEAPS